MLNVFFDSFSPLADAVDVTGLKNISYAVCIDSIIV